MQTTFAQINNLPVETESGQHLGKLDDLILDNEAHTVRKYVVKPGIMQKELLVDPTQIVAINENKIIVTDELVADPAVAPSM